MPNNNEDLLNSGTTEKPVHLKYLREFRVEQCPLFVQHKCTQHRPFTCFHWHFPNQKRRRPTKKKDGTFNYSPDNYCSKYDENSGVCSDGDECALLHRVAGDVERRYHLRYYKSGMCVHDTDARGFCVKNGAHCAFAHGTQDLRTPIYDIRELQAIENPELDISTLQGPNALDKERNLMADDPKWQDSVYVLANYKTEQCKKPPRLCRQGYACPQFHNNKDRRRTPRKFKYRSTPCPNVKHGDDWGDPTLCDSGDNCSYCHTRTEQQFHPEIYKSTKCHDVQNAGYCPRGAFCAFAHNDQELNASREEWNTLENGANLAEILSTALPDMPKKDEVKSLQNEKQTVTHEHSSGVLNSIPLAASAPVSVSRTRSANEAITVGLGSSFSEVVAGHINSTPGPIAKPRSSSVPGGGGNQDLSLGMEATSFFTNESFTSSNAFSGWEDRDSVTKSVDSGVAGNMSTNEDHRTNSSGIYGSFGGLGSIGSPLLTSLRSVGSPMIQRFAQQEVGDNVNALGSALEELAMEDAFGNCLESDRLARDSLAAGLASSVGSSAPVNIPRAGGNSHRILSPPSPPFMARQNSLSYGQSTFSYGSSHVTVGSMSSNHAGSCGSHNVYDQGPMSAYSSSLGNNNNIEVIRLKEELSNYKAKLSAWDAGIAQARLACEAWKREAEDARVRATRAEQQRDDAVSRLNVLEQQVGSLKVLACPGGIEQYASETSQSTLKSLEIQLKAILDKVSEAVVQVPKKNASES